MLKLKKNFWKAVGISGVLATSYAVQKKLKKVNLDDSENKKEKKLMMAGIDAYLIIGGTILSLGFGSTALYASRYIRCPPNKVLVIFGGNKKIRTIHGGGAFVLPIFQDYRFLNLTPVQIEINLANTLSLHKLRVNVPSVFTVAVGTSEELMANAAERILELSVDELKYQAEEIIYGQLRDVIASMSIEQINGDRHLFTENVEASVEKELHKLGLQLINVNFTDVTDESGVIAALGKRAAAEAVQQARVEVAEREKEGSIGEAKEIRERDIIVSKERSERAKGVRLAELDQETFITEQEKIMKINISKATAEKEIGINQAKMLQEQTMTEQQKEMEISIALAKSQQEIGVTTAKFDQEKIIAEKQRDLEIANAKAESEKNIGKNQSLTEQEKRINEQKRDLEISKSITMTKQEIAISKASIEKEQTIAQQERDMRISISKSNADAVEGENLANQFIQKSKAELEIVETEAYEMTQKRKKEAEQKVIEAEAIAKKKAFEAIQEQIKQEELAKTIGPAEALKQKILIEAQANAEKIIIEAEAKSKADLLEMEAKAKGEYLFLEARAKGLGLLIEKCGGSREAANILMLDHVEELAKTSAQAISNIKFDNITIWENGNGKEGKNSTSNFIKDIATSLPPLHSMMTDVAGVDMKSFLEKFDK
eukprot:gene4623-8196_t